MGEHLVKSWSSTQPGVTLSSGEAELCGVIRGSGMGLGFQSLMADLGHDLPLRVWTDSSAAIGICTRQGLGKLRHIDTHLLWIQQAVRSKRVDIRKVLGEENPADLFTKHLSSRDRVQKLVSLMGCKYMGGRAAAAPQKRAVAEGKVTIGEANVLVEDGPVSYHMPHLTYVDRCAMDAAYPPIVAAEDLEEDLQNDEDAKDGVYQQGLIIAEEIRIKMISEGRRKIERP